MCFFGGPTVVAGTLGCTTIAVDDVAIIDTGEAMGLSALTIKSHLARIARKLGTGDRAGMVAAAMRARVID